MNDSEAQSVETMIVELWKSRLLIVFVVGVITIMSVIVSLLLPPYYRSTATLLPESDQNKLGALAGFADIANLAGVSVGKVTIEQLFPDIIRSRTVIEPVLAGRYKSAAMTDSASLIQFWDIDEDTEAENVELALRKMREDLEISVDKKTNLVSVSILTRDPQVSALIINAITDHLDSFIQNNRTTSASERRRWIDKRLVEVKADLDKSESSLTDFREQNRRISDSPKLLQQEVDLERMVTLNSVLYTELKKQYELARIEEVRDIPIINILDSAKPATRKEKPRRAVIVILSFILSLASVCGFVVFRQRFAPDIKGILSNLASHHHEPAS